VVSLKTSDPDAAVTSKSTKPWAVLNVAAPPVAVLVYHNPLSSNLWLESNSVNGSLTLSLPNASMLGVFANEISLLIILYEAYPCAMLAYFRSVK
jgi:hypothetical protein